MPSRGCAGKWTMSLHLFIADTVHLEPLDLWEDSYRIQVPTKTGLGGSNLPPSLPRTRA